MFEKLISSALEKLSDPLQLLTLVVIACLFLIIKMLVALLNRKEDILEKMVGELSANSSSVKQAVLLLEFLAHRRGQKE